MIRRTTSRTTTDSMASRADPCGAAPTSSIVCLRVGEPLPQKASLMGLCPGARGAGPLPTGDTRLEQRCRLPHDRARTVPALERGNLLIGGRARCATHAPE